jgi:hypothetical protein
MTSFLVWSDVIYVVTNVYALLTKALRTVCLKFCRKNEVRLEFLRFRNSLFYQSNKSFNSIITKFVDLSRHQFLMHTLYNNFILDVVVTSAECVVPHMLICSLVSTVVAQYSNRQHSFPYFECLHPFPRFLLAHTLCFHWTHTPVNFIFSSTCCPQNPGYIQRRS